MSVKIGTTIKHEAFSQEELDFAFPNVSPEFEPCGNRVLVQLRSPKTKSKGGIILTNNDIEVEKWSTQIAKVIKVGALAFRNNTTLEPWIEGKWCEVGDFVRIPKYLQDKWEVQHEDREILFMLVSDTAILAKCTGDPLDIKAYL